MEPSAAKPVSVASHFPHGNRRDGRGTASSGRDYSCAAICMRRNQHGDPCCRHRCRHRRRRHTSGLNNSAEEKSSSCVGAARFGAIYVKFGDGSPGFTYDGSKAGSEEGSCVSFSFSQGFLIGGVMVSEGRFVPERHLSSRRGTARRFPLLLGILFPPTRCAGNRKRMAAAWEE